MATFTPFAKYWLNLGKAVIDWNSHTFKLALTNTAPTTASDNGFLPGSSHPPPAATNGYTSGGNTLTCAISLVGTAAEITIADSTFTASGGNLGPFRYALVYDDTAASDELVGVIDYGSSITLANTETFTVDFPAVAHKLGACS